MKCLIINHDADYKDDLIRLFRDFSPVVVRYTDFSSSMANEYDFIVLSGGSIIIDGDNLTEEKEFLRNTKKPIFGICLGFELICLAYGVKRNKFDKTRSGFFISSIIGKRGKLWYWHNYFINEKPDDFKLLSRRNDMVEEIEHISKPIFGIQGHPEKSGEYGEKIRDLFVEKFVKNWKPQMSK